MLQGIRPLFTWQATSKSCNGILWVVAVGFSSNERRGASARGSSGPASSPLTQRRRWGRWWRPPWSPGRGRTTTVWDFHCFCVGLSFLSGYSLTCGWGLYFSWFKTVWILFIKCPHWQSICHPLSRRRAIHKWRQLHLRDFGPSPLCRYQIHATSLT